MTGTSFSTFWIGEASLARRLSRPICRSWLHQIEQLSIEIDRAVLSEPFQLLIHRRNFDQARDITPRPDRNRHVRHFQSQNLVSLALDSNAFDFFHAVPFLQCDDQIQPLLDSNAADAENRSDVDDANTANF